MTVKGILKQMSSRRNAVVVILDHESDPNVTYHGEMERICAKPRKWLCDATVLMGAPEYTVESALVTGLIHRDTYEVDKCDLDDAISGVVGALRADMNSKKVTHSMQLIIKVNTD